MSMTRRPVASGTFYPSEPGQLKSLIKSCLPEKVDPARAKAAILPHAGYIYSGRVAVETAAQIVPYNKLFILGPNHTGRGKPFSVFSSGAWQTPLGEIPIDSQTAQAITQKGLLEEDTEAHLYEHSIEVQLPILQYLFKDFSFVPIVCAVADLAAYRDVAEAIHKAVQPAHNKYLLIASSDMTHFEEAGQAERKDRYTLEAILKLDTQGYLKRVAEKNVSMCGLAPVGILLEVLKLLNAKEGRLVDYATSADVTNDRTSVVGYAGVIFN
jgi:AmmeMemoRadiSam system protein B